MDPSSAVSAISAGLGASFRILEKGFEINAVGDQAKSVLRTVDQVSGQLRDATTLRRQKSSLFTKLEKQMIDKNIKYTEEAISLVATLVEPARADLEVSGGSIRFGTRLLFILRDSPRIHICLTQLGIASQSLNRDLTILCGREGHSSPPVVPQISVKPAPPSYEEVIFLTEQRQRNVKRRGSALSLPVALAAQHAASTTSFDNYTDNVTTSITQHLNDLEDYASEENRGFNLSRPRTSPPSTGLHPPIADDAPSSHHPPSVGHLQGIGRERSLRWLESRLE